MRDGGFMEHLNWNIIYKRSKIQYDSKSNKWIAKTFYIRATKGVREYGAIKDLDKLLLLGVFNNETKEYQEWAFNDVDQEALFKEVFNNFVSIKERKRLLERLNKVIDTQVDHTLKPYTLPFWVYEESKKGMNDE